MRVNCDMRVALRHGLSISTCIVYRYVHTPTWCRLGLAGNVNSVIGGMYLGVTCVLIQPWGILGVWRGLNKQ